MKYTLFTTTAALALSLSVVSCTKTNKPTDGSAAGTSATPIKPSVPADVNFMQGMIGHHAQALRMVALAPTHGASDKVLLLCKKIEISQQDEITTMTQWLLDRGQAVPDTSKPMAMAMPGMLTPEQMTQLEAAHGADFDRLFLTDMIQHHNGALAMVKDLFATNGAAQSPEIFQYATDVNVDQTGEIDRMQKLLNFPPPPHRPQGAPQNE